ncbi:hypothetical protein PIB30_095271 [Stylosanthes scabra]|uniref:Uncharacterized protein n=1 Tax=Stylosanthes scabra TaxID=79078 RepID=A0ABU6TV60_9FABA|nr:hypothetical protein [Stylosanthes scabra]
MNVNKFYETEVPAKAKAKADYHALTKYNGEVGFLSQTKVELGTLVQLWSLKDGEEDNMMWEKMITVTGIGIIYNSTIVFGKDLFSVTEAHSRFGCSNEAQRTDVVISKHQNEEDRPEDLMSISWKMNVVVKTVALHCDGLYVLKYPKHLS